MKKSTIVLGAAGLLLCAAVAFPTRPANVASVDLQKVLGGLNEQKSIEQRLKTLGETLNAETEKLKRDLQDQNAEVENYKAGTPAWNDAVKKVEAAASNVAAQEQYVRLKGEFERAAAVRMVFGHVQEAVAAVAKQMNVDMVFISDAGFGLEQGNLQSLSSQLTVRRMIYTAPEFDITEAVIAQANADQAKRGAMPAPVITPSTLPGAGAAPAGAK